MNNWIGLLIALSLAMVAGVLNWKYLERKSQEIEMVSFVAIKDGVRIKPGDQFTEQNFVPVNIPRKNVGNLENTAVLYSYRDSIVSMKALKPYVGGEMVLAQDLKTPPEEFKLAPDEVAIFVPVDGGSFVSSLVEPGDMVSFYLNASIAPIEENPENDVPPDNDQNPEWNLDGSKRVAPAPPLPPGAAEYIGPFRVLSLGDRLGSYQVSKASGGRSAQENVMGIAVKRVGNGVEPKAEKLLKRVNSASFRQAGFMLHPRTKPTS